MLLLLRGCTLLAVEQRRTEPRPEVAVPMDREAVPMDRDREAVPMDREAVPHYLG